MGEVEKDNKNSMGKELPVYGWKTKRGCKGFS
jgi:hypothetical protein